MNNCFHSSDRLLEWLKIRFTSGISSSDIKEIMLKSRHLTIFYRDEWAQIPGVLIWTGKQ